MRSMMKASHCITLLSDSITKWHMWYFIFCVVPLHKHKDINVIIQENTGPYFWWWHRWKKVEDRQSTYLWWSWSPLLYQQPLAIFIFHLWSCWWCCATTPSGRLLCPPSRCGLAPHHWFHYCIEIIVLNTRFGHFIANFKPNFFHFNNLEEENWKFLCSYLREKLWQCFMKHNS